MKILKFVPIIILVSLISCGTQDDMLEQFIGNWELSHFSWNDCEDSGTDRSLSIAVGSGGCFFDGCISMNIRDDGSLVTKMEEDDGDQEPYTYETTYEYNEADHSILIDDKENEFDGLVALTIVDGELVIPFKEDGCDAEYRMRKL